MGGWEGGGGASLKYNDHVLHLHLVQFLHFNKEKRGNGRLAVAESQREHYIRCD